MPKGKHYSVDLKEKIIEAFKAGVCQKDISSQFSVSKDVVSKTIKLFKLHGVIINHKRRGRPQKTSEKLDRLIKRVSQKIQHYLQIKL